jgi:outer membrane autotransporter protein
VTANNQIAPTANVLVNGTLDLGGTNQAINGLTGAGTVQLDDQAVNAVFGPPFAGTTAGILTVNNGFFTGKIIDNGFGGQLIKNTPGILTLNGVNTYIGNTTINGGSLIVNGSIASKNTFVNPLGLLGGSGVIGGNVFNNGTVSPGASIATLTVKGNYTQTSKGTLVIEVAGTGAKQSDVLAVGGTANLDGNLRILNVGGLKLKRGDKVTFLTATGGVNGKFSNVSNAFSTGNPLLDAQVVYNSNFVSLQMLQGSFAGLSGLLGLTPNQIAVARALDQIAQNVKSGEILDYLDALPTKSIPSALDDIAPEEYASIFSLGVSLANVQTANLQRRMDDLRAGATGFTSSGYSVGGGGYTSGGTNYGNNGPSGKGGKELVAPSDRVGVFITGAGEFSNITGTYNARGYDLTTGGFTLGVDYRLTDNFVVGLMAGYANTGIDLFRGGRISVDGGKLGVYATYFTGGFYVDTAVTGGYNSYDTRRRALAGTARGSTTGGELNALFAAGYDFKTGGLTIGPTASFQYTYVGIGKFSENGSLAPLQIGGQHNESLRSALGFKASYDWQVGGVVIRPEVRAAWQHEFGDVAYAVDSRFSTGGGGTFTVNGPELGRDSALLGAGFAVLWNERTSTYVYYDGELGRSNYNSQNVSGGVRMSF